MDLKKKLFDGLKETSRRSEKEMVLDFASDRFTHFIGVYLMVLLAIVSKIGQVIGSRLHCYDATDDGSDFTFYKYAESYCWYSEKVTSSNISALAGTCAALVENRRLDRLNLPTNPQLVKSFVQWLPYALLIEAFILCLPSVYWSFRVGERLKGHVLFLQNLQNDIYEDIKGLPSGIYRRGVKLAKKQENKDVNDRLMMSLLCQENLSSFDRHLFLSSVYKLMPELDRKGWPLKAVILQQWCRNDGNLGNHSTPILVKCYEMKQFIATVVSLACISAHLVMACVVISSGWGENIFPCDIPRFQNRCVVCTFPNILESFAILMSASIASCVYMAFTLRSLWTFQSQKSLLVEDFFDYATGKGSFFALTAAAKLNK